MLARAPVPLAGAFVLIGAAFASAPEQHPVRNLVMLEIVEAGCRIFIYQDGQEVKLDTPIAKQMISMRNYAAEDFNANISAKTQAALLLKARAGHATGTRTYGYDLVRVGEGKSSHVERRIHDVEAQIVRKVFTLAAKGAR